MATIRINGREYAGDSDGVIEMPYRVMVDRYVRAGELREFRIEWFHGASGVVRIKVSRVIVRRIAPRVNALTLGRAKAA